MTRRYETEEDVLDLVREFEAATVSRDQWNHAEHLIVALYYVSQHDVEKALDKMRCGILNLLANGFKVDLSKEMPYHETITVFWIHAVASFYASSNGEPVQTKISEMIERFDKDFPLRFYSRELLFSDAARGRFVSSDLDQLPW